MIFLQIQSFRLTTKPKGEATSLCSLSLTTIFIFSFASLLILGGCDSSDKNGEAVVSDSTIAAEEKELVDYPPVAPETITLEDGTGIISLGMHRDEVIKQFEEWSLNYTLDYQPEISKYSDINVYYGAYTYGFDPDGILFRVDLDVTSKGLEYWDSLSKMIEIYGDGYEYDVSELESGGELRIYYYNWPNGTSFVVEVYFENGSGNVMSGTVYLQRYI